MTPSIRRLRTVGLALLLALVGGLGGTAPLGAVPLDSGGPAGIGAEPERHDERLEGGAGALLPSPSPSLAHRVEGAGGSGSAGGTHPCGESVARGLPSSARIGSGKGDAETPAHAVTLRLRTLRPSWATGTPPPSRSAR